jgi:hypothetical protein
MTSSQWSRRGVRWAVLVASTAVVSTAAVVPAAYAGGGNHHASQGKLSASLTGAKEVPGPGDPNGRGKAKIQLKKHEICFQLAWRNIGRPTAAHIHEGSSRVAGPVVVPLFSATGGLDANLTNVGGCVDASAKLIAEIRKDPRDYYVNIHNAAYPAGAIRGQLHR